MKITIEELENLLNREWVKGYEKAMEDKAEFAKKEAPQSKFGNLLIPSLSPQQPIVPYANIAPCLFAPPTKEANASEKEKTVPARWAYETL